MLSHTTSSTGKGSGTRVSLLTGTLTRDVCAIICIFLLPLLINVPTFLGWWSVDPVHFFSGIASFHGRQLLHGYPCIDPSTGFIAQALGKVAAQEWLSGKIPWWNYYSGVGRPLAAEMSPGAFFLPFVLLHHFSNGMLYFEAILQILAGLGTYCLLRKIGLIELAAFTGAVLYQFNGAFVWLGPMMTNPAAFLPWLILGIEHARERSLKRSIGGSWIVAIPLAFSIYAGFPETAYINGLLAVVWSFWRLFGLPSGVRLRFIGKLAAGVIVGLMLSAPIVVPFLEYLHYSYLGGHTSNGGFGGLRSEALPQLFFPLLYGIPWSYHDSANVANGVWSAVGGYFSAAQLGVIVLGLVTTRRSSLFIVLLLWILISLGRSFALPFVSTMVDLVPLLKLAAFFRYAAPSWEFCSAVMCAKVINDLNSANLLSGRKLSVGLVAALVILTICLYPARNLVAQFYVHDSYRVYFWVSLALGFGGIIAIALAFRFAQNRPILAARATAALLLVDAIALFSIPSFSGVIDSKSRSAGVDYLKRHIGTDRFYTLGPIAPNYGAYYRIASINHNALPIAANWVKYIQDHIDPYAHPAFFTGNYRADPKSPTPVEVLQDNLGEYEQIGVRYVVSPHSQNPFARALALLDSGAKAFNLSVGQSIAGKISGTQFVGSRIDAVRILIGNYSGMSDGRLRIRLSADGYSATGERNLKESQNNQPFLITLNQPITLASGKLHYEVSDIEGTNPVALWIYPQIEGQQTHNSPEIPPGYAPRIEFLPLPQPNGERPQIVFESSDMDIYELPEVKPYFEVLEGDSELRVENRAVLSVNCSSQTRLVRRELYYPGWKAFVAGKKVHIESYNEIFQAIRIPVGQYKIVFTYIPTHMRLITVTFLLGLFWVVIGPIRSQMLNRKIRSSSPEF
jgi:hypothetical protein